MKQIAILPVSLSLFLICISLSSKGNAQTQTYNNPNTNGTPANYSFIAPAGITSVTVQAWGAGGGGATKSITGNGGGGGGGGAYAERVTTVIPGNSYNIVVGAGGAANNNGGSSSFNNNSVIAAGGSGANNNSNTGASGGLSSNSIGSTRYSGGNGANGGSDGFLSYYSGGGGGGAGSTGDGNNASSNSGGNGRTISGGNGANGLSEYSVGIDGSIYGGGGSGGIIGINIFGSTRAGGRGANGLVTLDYTCPTYSLTSTTVTPSVCPGNPATVTLTGLPTGTYTVTYNRSAPNAVTNATATMTVSTAGTGSFTTANLSNSGNTTITITNLRSGSSGSIGSCSNFISTNRTAAVNVGVPSITGTTPDSRSGTGTITLGATASAGNIHWYANMNGGTILHTGTSFITPSISSTTTYYVSATNGTCASTPRTAVIATVIIQPEIDVRGNTISITGTNNNTPVISNNTHFGTTQIVSETKTRTFVIHNTRSGDLNIETITLSNTTDFKIDSSPANTIIPPAGSANLVISFKTSTVGVKDATLSILSNDQNESNYQIRLRGEGKKIFYDSDGDGIYDDVDIDADNDGISNSDEEAACRLSGGASLANYKLLNETFGSGTTRTTINTTYDATTTYCYENGTGTASCNVGGNDLQDGEYTVHHDISSLANWAPTTWYTGGDHTGNPNGRMALFNAANDPGIFYTARITGALPDVPITYSFWALNLDTQTTGGIGTRTRPNIKVEFKDANGNLLHTLSTGDIPPSINGNPSASWHSYASELTSNVSEFYVYFINNNGGGLGNDLAIDDIVISQTLCDTDGDGIANIFDLDSDNDGIPDIVEAHPNATNITGDKGHLTDDIGWLDSDGNGMDDRFELLTPVDTDGDGIPDYLDLDSDNDGLFDVDESGATNSNAPSFQNGDGDINGDGVGDGSDSDAYREKDADGDGVVEYFSDGILDVFDFYEGNTFISSYGNHGQSALRDTDGDGIPDYRDLTSNGVTFDITQTIYANLDTNNDGKIDSTTDADGDGIMASRDSDETIFGSPRKINSVDSYSLYFDGRNDFVDNINVISSGSASLMAFVKPDGANFNNTNQIILGQSDFLIRLNHSNKTITAIVGGVTLTSTTSLTDGIWAHVAVTSTAGESILYINGVQEDTSSSGGITSVSNFRIGNATTNTNYFKGEIDEVRVFNKLLTSEELKRMVYQELDETNGFNSGKIIPNEISTAIGTHLVKYFKMDGYNGDILDDKTTPALDIAGAKMYNFKTIKPQTAPLPYVTNADGDWTNPTSWLYGDQWDITSKHDNASDASIVHIQHNLRLDGAYNTLGTVGIIVDATKNLEVTANKGLYNSWYIKLDGLIDLDGESQLIQTEHSVLDANSSGALQRDQQGTKDLFTYNYWASPVGTRNVLTNNNSYTVANVLKDGSIPESPVNINFLGSGYDGNPGSSGVTPISIANYWIHKYANLPNNTYSAWQRIRSNGLLLPGEGFTMKGVSNTNGNVLIEQNYVFEGKPNNGDITLAITAGNDYLIGNPYPSALDADAFILDNIADGAGRAGQNIINGALYFWDHFGGGSHYLADYQGGYAVYTLMGGTEAISSDTRINATGQHGSKIPQRHIPVAQGFFVSSIIDNTLVENGLVSPIVGGNITFKNSQRAFITEGSNQSLFVKPGNNKSKTTVSKEVDNRQKIRLMFDSPKGYHRQLLIGVDERASNAFDLGFDAPLIEVNKEDMFWVFNNKQFIIQAVNNFDKNQIFPLGIKINQEGVSKIKIDALENITNDFHIYLYDKALDVAHPINESPYEVFLTPGEYLNRFEITFKSSVKQEENVEDVISNENPQNYPDETENIIVNDNELGVENPIGENPIAENPIVGHPIVGYPVEPIVEQPIVEYPINESPHEDNLIPSDYIVEDETGYSDSVEMEVEDVIINRNLKVYFSNERQSIIIHNPDLKQVKSVELMNLLGQSIQKFNNSSMENYIEYTTNPMSTGVYLIKVQTPEGYYSKKVLMK